MNKRKLFFVIVLIVMGVAMSACQSRNPHCPGVSVSTTPVEQPQKI